MVEPRDTKPEFFEIVQLLLQASDVLDILFNPVIAKKSTLTSKSGGSVSVKKPELLVKTKKYRAMEMEMDKFLAKKQQIFQNNELSKNLIMMSICHMVLKSFYENVRCYRYNTYGA